MNIKTSDEITIQDLVYQMWSKYDPESLGYVDKIEAQNFVNEVFNKLGKSSMSNAISFNKYFIQFDKVGDGSITKDGLIQLLESMINETKSFSDKNSQLSKEQVFLKDDPSSLI